MSILGFPLPETKGRRILGLLGELARQVARRLGPARAPAPFRASTTKPRARTPSCRSSWRYTENPGLVLIYTALRCLNLAERGASPETAAMAFSQAVVLAATVPLHAAARRYEQIAKAALGRTTDRNAHSFAPIALAVFHAGIGNWDTAADYAGTSAQIAHGSRVSPAPRRRACMAAFHRDRRWQPQEATADLQRSQRVGPAGIAARADLGASARSACWRCGPADRREAEAQLREFEALRPARARPGRPRAARRRGGPRWLRISTSPARAKPSIARSTASEKVRRVLIEMIDPCARLAEGYVMLMRKAAAFGRRRTGGAGQAAHPRLRLRTPPGETVPDRRPGRAALARRSRLAARPPRVTAVKGWQAAWQPRGRTEMLYHQWRAHQALAEHHPERAWRRAHRTQADELER